MLASLQSKYDYSPKFDPATNGGRLEPTVACDSACKAIQSIISAVRTYEAKLLGLDLVKVFWRPFGQQVIGVLISHLRRQKISPEGCKFLNRDIKEYSRVSLSRWLRILGLGDEVLFVLDLGADHAILSSHWVHHGFAV